MKLIVMGDFHFPIMRDEEKELIERRNTFFGSILRQVLEEDADIMISLGDLTNEGCEEELNYIVSELQKWKRSNTPFVHVLGNHDTYSLPKKDILAITGQPRYHAMDTPEALLLFLDTTKEMVRDNWGGEIDKEQMIWLEEQLASYPDKPVLVFGHHPVYDTTSRSSLDMLCVHPEHDLQAVLDNRKGPAYYFCGHNHQQSIIRIGDWHYVQTAAVLDIPGYRIIEVSEGRLTVETVLVQDEEMLRHACYIGDRMLYFCPFPKAEGTSTDQALHVEHIPTLF
ncbi:MAG: metallophosphoesterase [Gorillibacterium sp.]|nr:metallophosphoesterase [Gorillibacterium sp.]